MLSFIQVARVRDGSVPRSIPMTWPLTFSSPPVDSYRANVFPNGDRKDFDDLENAVRVWGIYKETLEKTMREEMLCVNIPISLVVRTTSWKDYVNLIDSWRVSTAWWNDGVGKNEGDDGIRTR